MCKDICHFLSMTKFVVLFTCLITKTKIPGSSLGEGIHFLEVVWTVWVYLTWAPRGHVCWAGVNVSLVHDVNSQWMTQGGHNETGRHADVLTNPHTPCV